VKRHWNKTDILFFLLTCLLFMPLLRFQGDLWDGVLVSYSFLSKNTEILHTWFAEAALYLSEWLYRPLFILAWSTGVSAKLLVTLVIMVSTFFSAREIKTLTLLLGSGKSFANLAMGLALVIPTLGLYFSSVFLMHVLMMYLCLAGTRLYLQGRYLIGLIFCVISLEHNINLVMFASFLTMAYASGFRSLKDRRCLAKDASSILLLLGAIIVLKVGFPAVGLYVNYNKPTLSNLKNWRLFWMNFEAFAYFYPPTILLVGYCFLKSFSLRWLGCFALITTACILPYVLAGKYHDVLGLYGGNGWNLRFIMNLVYVFIAASSIWLGQNLKWSRFVKFVFICQFAWLGLHTVRYYSVQHKLLSFQEAASKKIKSTFTELGIDKKSGVIYQNRTIVFAPQFYVMQWILLRGLGNTSWLASLQNKDRHAILQTEGRYRDKYIQSHFQENCTLELHWLPMQPVEKGLVSYFFEYTLLDDRSGFIPKFRLENLECQH